MLKGWISDMVLSLQARSGMTPGFFVWVAILVVSLLATFVFLCVAAYVWLTPQFGAVYAGLIMAGVFLLFAIVAALVSAILRRRARERAILERAARAHASPSWLLDPKVLGIAVQVGRTLGWERLIPIALLGFLAAQWARGGYRQDEPPRDS
jgi:type VI protein secretion system component VasK